MVIVACATLFANNRGCYNEPMSKADTKKRLAVERIIAYVMEDGLSDVGLRKLASVAGTSDRMLIYYFGTKDELINLVLNTIAGAFTNELDRAMGGALREPDVLMRELTELMEDDAFMPSVQLWFELVGLGARGQEPYASNAKLLAANWIDWINSRLVEPSDEVASDLYAHLDGRLMLKMIDP